MMIGQLTTRRLAVMKHTLAPITAALFVAPSVTLHAQVKAVVAVNRELILLYWHFGREILRAQKADGRASLQPLI